MDGFAPRDWTDLRNHVDNLVIGLRIDRYSWWTHWREIANYLIPRRYKWFITPNQMNRGSPINNLIIDSSPAIALRTCSAGMMAGITSPSRPWMRMTLEDDSLAEHPSVRVWLDEVTRLMLHVFAKSNYYTSKHMQYTDLAAFGTAPVIIYEDFKDVIRCYNPCAGEYYLQNSYRLEVDTFAREYVRNMSQMVQEFGLENCSTDVQTAYKTGGAQLTREKIMTHVIEPTDAKTPALKKTYPYREVYWEWGSSKNLIMRMRGFHEFPVSAPRWDLVSNDAYGRSPGMDALGDIKQLQVEQKRKAQGIDKQVNPPLLGDPSLKNEPMSTIPGGITYVSNIGSNAGLKPIYEVKPDLEHMVKDIEQVTNRIDRVFFKDLFMMISELDTVRSAAEIAERKSEKMLQLGPMLERFHNEGLQKDIDRTFAIMWRAGMIPKPPAELRGQRIKIEYTSVLAEAQRAVMTTAIERLVSFVGSIASGQEGRGGHPDILDNLDWDEITDTYAGMLGVPAKLVIPMVKVAKIRLQRQRDQQQAQAAQNALAAVQGLKTMSDTNVGGGKNAVQAMTGA